MTDDGELHFRRTGGRLSVRSSGPRLLHATVLRWEQPVRLSTGGTEWFNRDREPPLKPAVLTLQHGGPVVGEVIEWRSSVLGLDATLIVRESAGGDGLLALVDKYGELPCSPAFLGDGTRHSGSGGGVRWRRLHVPELAVVAEGELPWCRLRRFAA